MDPRTWTGIRVLLVSLLWITLAGYLTFRGSGTPMTASGPSGGLVGISFGALPRTVALVFGPPLALCAIWVLGRASTKPPRGIR
jgi:hypothetical protein